MDIEKLNPEAIAKPKRPVGRPVVFTEDIRAKAIEMVAQGLPRERVGHAFGIDPSAFCYWSEKDEEFSKALKKAEVECELFHLARIKNAMQGKDYPAWQASMCFLERRYPKRYGRKGVKITINQGAAVALPPAPEYKTIEARVVKTEPLDADCKALPETVKVSD